MHWHKWMVKASIALISIMIILPLSVSSQGSTTKSPEELKRLFWVDQMDGTPLPLATDAKAPDSMPESDSIASDAMLYGGWSRMVFQSYRDNDWEIYLARGDGSARTRLTEHHKADIYPRLNHGASQIVFASNRFDHYDIFTTNVTGAGPQRLTIEGASDTVPVWSPDGSRIAFMSNRAGNWDIYVMNKNGSGVTRLTQSSADDVTPSWSRANGQIAWIRRGENYSGVIWAMNPDGSQARALTGNLPIPQHVVWSPDGTQIAFDADLDGDVWSELAILDLADGSIRIIFDLGHDMFDAWMGSWSPDGNWFLFSTVEYVVYQNQLYISRAFVDKVPATGGIHQRVFGSGVDMHGDWASIDVTPPTSSLQPLDTFTRSPDGTVALTLQGEDTGGAGLYYYDIQVRDGTAEDWQSAWSRLPANDVSLPNLTYDGTPGHTYAFRSRAVDKATNIESWPGQPEAATTVYAWHAAGNVLDARGQSVAGATLDMDPGPFIGGDTDARGHFDVYSASSADHTIMPIRLGYTSPDSSTFSAESDLSDIELFLRPADDVITNGGFEQGALDGWNVLGTHVTAASEDVFAGQQVAELGQQWNLEPFREIADADHPAIGEFRTAADASGTVHVAWASRRPTGEKVAWYARWDPISKTWLSPERISGSHQSHESSGFRIAVSDNGTALVAFGKIGGGIGIAERTPAGEWLDLQVLSGLGNSFDMVFDDEGTLHFVFFGDGLRYRTRSPDGVWTPSIKLWGTGSMNYPNIHARSDGSLIVIWQSIHYQYRVRSSGGQWQPAVNTGLPNELGLPEKPLDGLDRVHLIERCSETIQEWQFCHAAIHLDGSVTQGELLPYFGMESPLLSATQSGQLYVWWREMHNTGRDFFLVRGADGGWSKPLWIDPVITWRRQMVVVGEVPHLFYKPACNRCERLVHSRLHVVNAQSVDAISQIQTVGSNSHHPTLSFLYQFNNPVPESGNHLEVLVEPTDNGSSRLVWSTVKTSADWTQAWVDLSFWAGEEVTLTFRTTSEAGYPTALARLDEVSLGSWETPIIDSVEPAHILPGVETTITIHGQNFMPTPIVRANQTHLTGEKWIDSETVQATLPAGLPAGLYNLWLKNPGGQAAAAPSGLRIGSFVFLPMISD